MSLAEGVSARIVYKAYATGVITSNTQPVSGVDPGQSGGQILRRVGSTLSLSRDTFQSNEIRSDRQIGDYRLGTKRVQGNVSGEFSPSTWWDFFEASCRTTEVAAPSFSNSDFTSVSADNTTSKFSFTSGDPTTKLTIGQIVRFTNLSDAGNDAKNFLVVGFGGTSNRDVTVYPAPDTMSADNAFTAVGFKSITVPSSSFTSRKFALEIYNSDLDMARLFTECRIGGFTLNLPASGMATMEVPVMGRDMETLEASNAPFFTSPAAETTTGVFAAVNGLLRLNGATIGVVTGLSIQMNLNPSADPVVGQDIVPEIFLGRANVTGQVTADLQDFDLVNNFVDEDEIDILCYLTTSNASAADAVSIYLPRVKFTNADVATSGEGAQTVTLPFQALKYTGAAAGVPATTIQIVDTVA